MRGVDKETFQKTHTWFQWSLETFSESQSSLDSPDVPRDGPRLHAVQVYTVQQEEKQMYKLHVPGKESVGERELTCLRLVVWEGPPTEKKASEYLSCYGYSSQVRPPSLQVSLCLSLSLWYLFYFMYMIIYMCFPCM